MIRGYFATIGARRRPFVDAGLQFLGINRTLVFYKEYASIHNSLGN